MTKGLQTIIFIFRHGRTDRLYIPIRSVDNHRILGEIGKKQAKLIGSYLDQFNPQEIYSSPMMRCRQTSEIIQKELKNGLNIQYRQELADVYGFNSYRQTGKKNTSLLNEIVKNHPGEQVVVVSHQIPIEHTLRNMGVTEKEIDSPCLMGEGYRLVFAGKTLTEVTKIRPASHVV